MLFTSSFWSKTVLLAGVALAAFGVQETVAQRGQGRTPQSGGGNTQQSPTPQARAQGGQSLIHGVTIGAGLAVYQGDFSLNPNHNVVKYVAGNGQLAARVGIDHRLGQFDQYGLGVDVVYSRLSGESAAGNGFQQNSVFLDFYADYELPYIKAGLFRVFVGGGPNIIISPSYTGEKTPRVSKEENYQPLGTRVAGSLKIGVTIMDSFRVGTRISSSDLLDGYKGYTSDGIPDFVSFLILNYRFSVK